ncbi:ABC transporter permease [Alginatibacterium sediminis]|uniref:ABC transporter permease n=1 Tax=Alginatibacterium sediminis TaxID=2164068 RepID=A0A420E6C5_9ALTE|nr:ABC transporter permease [Alginatibacterium sediminis]RKF13709.1 ABC transporter permease [Alginatibacterium sediminis]
MDTTQKSLRVEQPFGKVSLQFLSRYWIFIALVVLIVAFSLLSDSFLSKINLLNILRQVSIIGICAVGMTMVILTGGIDLSVGSMIGVSGMACALMLQAGIPPVLAVFLTLVMGLGFGGITGLLINKIHIPPLIATLGLMTALRGVAYILNGGLPIYGIPESVKFLGQGWVFGIPFPVILMIAVFVLGYVLLNKTAFGRHLYGTGGNEEASRLSGVNVEKLKTKVYLLAFFLSTFAGIVLMARVNSGQPRGGTGYEMDIITAVVLGGVSIMGGSGRLMGVIAGVMIMGVLSNGMILLNIDEYVQWVVKGLVLLVAVGLDQLSNHKSEQ